MYSRIGLRLLGTAAPRGPRLPVWGSWGKNAAEIAQLEAKAREIGAANLQFARGIAEITVRTTMRFRRLFGTHDGAMDRITDDLDTFARLNTRMLDGCEYAFEALAAEWGKSASPDFPSFVKSGALDPALGEYLQEAAGKHAAAGQRPTLAVASVNAEVLYFLVDDGSGKIVADVLFKAREKHGSVQEAGATASTSSAATASEPAVNTAVDGVAAAEMAGGGAPGEDATEGEAVPAAKAAEGEGDGYTDTAQVWTFEAERPSFSVYIRWMQNMFLRTEEGAEAAHEGEPPVTWRVRDINHVVHDDEPPDIIDSTAEEYMRESLNWMLRASLMMAAVIYVLSGLVHLRRPPGAPPLIGSQQERRPPQEGTPPTMNKWGDEMMPAAQQERA
eukprot:CAMPEP_0119354220 /NCGR_PEP_ID=MMETSP1334-20130426/3237_1 /TAXON_ID=127549 /ORGANISM="Calcidiscus leptoporus, Strain RCC1130" /LENGTH=388 /DNA_ID=CAMNT_0007367709 /DNA_START=1 /DNA_END=1167 /DNA_ORIENTATION=-